MRTPEHSSAAFTGSSVQADVSCFCCQISDPRTNEFTKHKTCSARMTVVRAEAHLMRTQTSRIYCVDDSKARTDRGRESDAQIPMAATLSFEVGP